MADLESGNSKKRVAGRQISKENPDLDDDGPEPEMGTFRKASDDVLATRRIVKVKRSQPAEPASSNPFASLRMVPPPNPTSEITEAKSDVQLKNDVDAKQENKGAEGKVEDKIGENVNDDMGRKAEENTGSSVTKNDSEVGGDNEADKEIENGEKPKEGLEEKAKNVTSFQQLSSSQNAFMGVAGTGFGSASFSFGSISTDKLTFSSPPSFGISSSNNGNNPAMQEKQTETGEENEKVVFAADAVLYEYSEGNWKERGKGELKVNVALPGEEKSRLVMRARGNYRLILNASLYPDMTLTNMDKKGVTFACINSAGEGKDGLATFAIKFKDSSFVHEFRGMVEAHKGKKIAGLKTPENSPKASDD